jgi:hypothetical protein
MAWQKRTTATSNSRNAMVAISFVIAAINVRKNIDRSMNESARVGPMEYDATISYSGNPKAAISETVPSVYYRYLLIPISP